MTRTARPYARIYTAPPTPTHAKDEAAPVIDLAEFAGRYLDTWQHLTLEKAMRTHRGRWVTPEVGVLTPRQNGKTELAIARELAGLFYFGEKIMHCNQSEDSERVAFERLLELIQSTPDLDREVTKVRRARNAREITTKHGSMIHCGHSSRSLGADLVVIDDAHSVSAYNTAQLYWTTVGSKNPQIWYLGCAVRKVPSRKNVISDPNAQMQLFTWLRKRGLTGTDPNLCWIEYSAPDDRDQDGQLLIDPRDPVVLRQANPSPRVSIDHLIGSRDLLAPEWFEAECLGIGDWPELEPAA